MRNTLLFALVTALGLSACANLDGKSAHELAKISRNRILTHDYSFNVEGELKAYISPIAEGVAQEAKATHQSTHQAAAKPSNEQENSNNAQPQWATALQGSSAQTIADLVQEFPAALDYIENARLTHTSAVDLKSKEIEIVPELSLNGRNEMIRLSLPMYINVEKKQIVVDFPARVPLVLNFLIADKNLRRLVVDKPIRIDAAQIDQLKGVPLTHAVQASVLAMNAAYEALPPEAFELKQMDAYGKQYGARYRVRYVDTKPYRQLLNTAFGQHFETELNRLRQQPEAGATSEGYDKIIKLVNHMQAEVLQPALIGNDEKNIGYADYYLDRKGRLKAEKIYTQINGQIYALNVVNENVYRNYGKPKFRFRSQAADAVDFHTVLQSITGKRKKEANQAEINQAETSNN